MVKTVKAMLDEATARIVTHSLAEARALHGRAEVQFIDIRESVELARDGTIPGAFHAPRGVLEFWADPASPYFNPVFGQGKPLLLFCAIGWRSALATRTLLEMGLTPVGHLAGGFDAWRAAGGPVAAVPENPMPGD
jgi:hypothetical protein